MTAIPTVLTVALTAGALLWRARFLTSAEQRYAAILAVAWGLEQTRYFTHDCDYLIVVTDHKPLVMLFGDRTLDVITNSRLFRLKQRTLPLRFVIQHASNRAADAASRHPSLSSNIDCLSAPDILESTFMAAIERDAHGITTLSWSRIAQETASDISMAHLVLLIERGITEADKNDPSVTSFWPVTLCTHKAVSSFTRTVSLSRLLCSVMTCNIFILPTKARHRWRTRTCRLKQRTPIAFHHPARIR